MKPEYLIFVGAIVSILGAALSGYGALKASQDQNTEQQKLIKATQDNADLSRRIAELNQQIAASVTGGDSYCYLTCVNLSKEGNFIFTLVNKGINPMYDVTISILDYSKVTENKNVENQNPYEKARTRISVGTLIPNTASRLANVHLGNVLKSDFIIEISARNGLFTQWIKLRKVNGEWEKAYRLVKNDTEAELFTDISKGFPLNQEGHVNWNEH